MRTGAGGRSARSRWLSAAGAIFSALTMMMSSSPSVLASAVPATVGTAGHPGTRPMTGLPVTGLAAAEHSGTFRDGGVIAHGAARFFGSPTNLVLAAPVVGMAATPGGGGYWLVGADGGVLSYGDARYFGGTAALRLRAPIVALAPTLDGEGYWLVGANGSVYSFGDAVFYGPARSLSLPDPIVGLARTPDGRGYWMVSSHGAVYSFGDARYFGSLGATDLHGLPVVAMSPSADGAGYWLVQGGGEVIAYGDAPRLGGMRGHPPVDGIAVTPDGRGYWLVCGNGEVDAFGDAGHLGGNNRAWPRPPIAAIVADPAAPGYWLLDAAAFKVNLGHPSPDQGRRVVSVAASQLGPSPDGGNYCNPYGPCEQWCALFATWVWERAGIRVPRYAFAGDVYKWARRHSRVITLRDNPAPGDLVLYGTGPRNIWTSPHMGVVAQVWPDGEIDTVEGDAGPGPGGWTSVLVNGPFLPAQSYFANGMPIYAFAVP